MVKDKKLEIMAQVEKQAESLASERKKELRRIFTANLLFEYRVTKYLAAFRLRYAKRKAEKEALKNQALTNELFSNLSDRENTVESHTATRGYLEFKLRVFENQAVLTRVLNKGSKNTMEKLYFCFYDDILAWKDKNTSQKVKGKVFLTTIDNVLPEQDLFFYFVIVVNYQTTKNYIYFFKCENQADRNKWVRSIKFLKDHALREIKPLEFEKYIKLIEVRMHTACTKVRRTVRR